ncbi:hypothetical protein FRC12_021506, partial [Ceratobasidium sp. 428]
MNISGPASYASIDHPHLLRSAFTIGAHVMVQPPARPSNVQHLFVLQPQGLVGVDLGTDQARPASGDSAAREPQA